MNNIYLSGPEWLTQYDCDVFNAVAGMFTPEDWSAPIPPGITTTAEKIFQKMRYPTPALYDAMTNDRFWHLRKISACIRKLALTRESVPELLALDMGSFLLHVSVVMTKWGFGFAIDRPSIKHLDFDDIIYIGGQTGGFWG